MSEIQETWLVQLPPDLRGTEPERPAETNLAIWRYELAGKLYSMAFAGRSAKPAWHYRFRSDAEREQYISGRVETARMHNARKVERAQTRKAYVHNYAVGDILSSSWGYDQTNVDFYKVVKVVSDKSIAIVEIGTRIMESSESGDRVMPDVDVIRSEPRTKRVDPSGYVSLTSYSSASKWDGKPMYRTSPFAGH